MIKGKREPKAPEDLRRRAEQSLKSESDRPDDVRLEEANSLIHELRVHQIELEMQNEELRRLHEDLEISRSRYADLYDFAPVGYLTLDREGLIVDANLTAAKQLGKERSRILNRLFSLHVLGTDRDAFHLHLAKVFKTGEHQTCEVRLAPGTGGEFYAKLDSIFTEDASGKGFARTSISDISFSKGAERELRERGEQLWLFAEHAPAAIAMLDANMRYVAVSRRWLSDYGLQGQQLLGRSHYDVFTEVPERWKEIHRRCMAGAVERGEEDIFHRVDGSCQWLRWEIYPWYAAPNTVGGIVIFSEDISEPRRMKEELRKAHHELERRVVERTAALEKANEELRQIPSKLISVQEGERKRLASELHDSIGQTLAALKFWVEMALHLRDAGDGNAALNHLEQFVPTLQRSIEETRNIYMGLRPSMLDSIGLLATLEWLRGESMRLYPQRHIELEAGVVEEEIPENLKISIFRIAQEALNNIAKHSKAEWVDISLSKNGDRIALVVSDDGVGIDLGLILQTSTARSLGLTGMRERAELTEGSFSIESTPGEGTTIRVCWPIEAEYQLQ
jgi:PAS domain S-box-containing protein